jgi:hypothetical protein
MRAFFRRACKKAARARKSNEIKYLEARGVRLALVSKGEHPKQASHQKS